MSFLPSTPLPDEEQAEIAAALDGVVPSVDPAALRADIQQLMRLIDQAKLLERGCGRDHRLASQEAGKPAGNRPLPGASSPALGQHGPLPSGKAAGGGLLAGIAGWHELGTAEGRPLARA